ncbi:MAG: 30S ribosomal protein S6 [Saprospiraceae bacterium]|nr:30S ribosomal protein S6 [Saprospiraceae bacterium]
MIQYEVTFIVDPVLSGDEIKSTAKAYEDLIKDNGASIVNVDDLGLKQLAYPIKKRTSGIYYVIEYNTPSGSFLPKMELSLKRDERILRFLNVRLDRYGIKYNEDKRNGLIGKKRDKVKEEIKEARKSEAPKAKAAPKPTPKPEPAPAPAPAASEEE